MSSTIFKLKTSAEIHRARTTRHGKSTSFFIGKKINENYTPAYKKKMTFFSLFKIPCLGRG
jgi:hypothetical protein